ncbi:MAG: pyridoxal 5'-phosphate synthase glutaminase subunit PdxT [Bacillota bacterium]|nr:pyridoxal 5'-phosphate synthase glutaminase subunit PdxT [Bacillota bacterium]
MDIAVLAVQGAFEEHINILQKHGVNAFELRQKSDLERPFDGLILPGGESTVMGKLLHQLDMFDRLSDKIQNGLPVLGTCAGLILLAKTIEADPTVHFGVMDMTVQRNGYGRQLGSFSTIAPMEPLGDIPMVFIRAPYIISVGEKAKVLAKVDERIVAARQDNLLVTAFHPELTDNFSVHQYFIDHFVK